MVCDQCGAERPRSGLCPECGAPPPGTYSSMREWKGRSSPDNTGRRSRGGSGSAWRADNSGRGSRSSSRWGGSGDNWQEDDYDEPAPARSNRRNRRPANNYDEVDLDRALVPARNEMMAPMDTSVGVPALPGFPQTDEEERAIGMRRPAYIPATTEKRKKKLSSWRVISGVLSVMLACIASCAAAGILGKDKIEAIWGKPIKIVQTQVPLDFSNVPSAPMATPGPAGKPISQVVTALHKQGTCNPVDPSSYFHTGDNVWVFVMLKQDMPGHTISVQWFANGIDVQPTGPGTAITLKDGAAGGACFALGYSQPGTGTAKIFWDRPANDPGTDPNDPALMATINFGILPPGAATPTAVPATPTTIPPTATPKK